MAATRMHPLVLMMAAQPDFTGWMPIGADAGRDCIAPVAVE